jgi:uncharacterized phage protein (TIGR02218 family)
VKTASVAYKAHLAGRVTTRAMCWKLTRQDGTVLGLTSHGEDIEVDGVTYLAMVGFTPSEIQTSAGLAVDGLEITTFLASSSFTEADLVGGLWDYAELVAFEVNYEDLSQGTLNKRTGTLGEVRYTELGFVAEVRGMAQQLQIRFGRMYLPGCDADLGDARCGINVNTFTDGKVTSTVTSVTSARQFTCSAVTQATGWFNGGKVTFTSGANDGLSGEVKTQTSAGVITLQLPMPHAIEAADGFTITVGCDKSFATCKAKFSNASRFRGFPHVAGTDRVWSGL